MSVFLPETEPDYLSFTRIHLNNRQTDGQTTTTTYPLWRR